MEQYIRALVKDNLSNLDSNFNKKSADVATFLDRPPSYVTRIHRTNDKRRVTKISPQSFRVTEPPATADRAEHRKYRMFALVCWLLYIQPRPDYELKQLFTWLLPDEAGTVCWDKIMRRAYEFAETLWQQIGDNGRRQHLRDIPAGAQNIAQNTAQESVPESVQESQPAHSEEVAKRGYPLGAADITIPLEDWAEMVAYLDRDARANDGLFSITTAYQRFADKLPESKQPKEFLRRDGTKEDIELSAEFHGKGVYKIPRGTNLVADIPDIPGIIRKDPIRGWCIHEDLFLDYGMFVHKDFKLVALKILRQTAKKGAATPRIDRIERLLEKAIETMVAGSVTTKAELAETRQQLAQTTDATTKIQETVEVLRANMAINRNGWIWSEAYVPLGYFTQDVLRHALRNTINPKFTGICTLSKNAATRLARYIAAFSKYLLRWQLTPNKDDLQPSQKTGIVPLNQLSPLYRARGAHEVRPLEFDSPTGLTPQIGYMCVVAAKTQYFDKQATGVSYDSYYSVMAVPTALRVLLRNSRYTAGKMTASSDAFWPTIAKSGGTQLSPDIYKLLQDIAGDDHKATDFLREFEQACNALVSSKVVHRTDSFGLRSPCIYVYKENKENQKIANRLNGNTGTTPDKTGA